jgi:hypothetical protein
MGAPNVERKVDRQRWRFAQRAVGERNEAATVRTTAEASEPELVERPARQRFTAENKLRIIHEAEACT